MTAASPLQVGGRARGSWRGVRATAPPRPSTGGPSFAAVAASTGQARPPPCAATAGGARGGGDGKKRAPADGGVSRVSLSDSPPPPRPEPKRKKGGPPPSNAAAGEDEGMRTPGSSVPAKDRGVGSRDVKVLSAVSLMMRCMAEVLALGDPAMSAAASPPSVLSPNVPGLTDGGLEGRGAKSKDGARVCPPRVSRRSPRQGGGLSALGMDRSDRPGIPPPYRGEAQSGMVGLRFRGAPPSPLPLVSGMVRRGGSILRGQGGSPPGFPGKRSRPPVWAAVDSQPTPPCAEWARDLSRTAAAGRPRPR